MPTLTLIPGDGIGPEVTASARAIADAAGAGIAWEVMAAGQRVGEETGNPLPPAVFESFLRNRVALKGPTGTPFGTEYKVVASHPALDGSTAPRTYPSVAIALRKEFALYMNVRPSKNYAGVRTRFSDVDLVIFRENSEDLYLGIERQVSEDRAEATKVITRGATERAARFACEYMLKTGRKRLTIAHKSNVLKKTDGLFLRTAQEVAARYPGIECDSRVIDALCMELVVRPESFDCLLLPNLYGDIVSDLTAGLVGGLGVAPGANLGEGYAMFEAVHGTAPDIAGQDRANPTSILLSTVMMLRYLGEAKAADRMEAAIAQVLRDGRDVTADLGGKGGTRRMTEAIVSAIGHGKG